MGSIPLPLKDTFIDHFQGVFSKNYHPFPAIFGLLPLMHVRKVVSGSGKQSCVSTTCSSKSQDNT